MLYRCLFPEIKLFPGLKRYKNLYNLNIGKVKKIYLFLKNNLGKRKQNRNERCINSLPISVSNDPVHVMRGLLICKLYPFPKKGVHNLKGEKMTNRNDNRNQPHTGKSDTEFASESNLSKKARKKLARERKKNQ